MQSTNFTRAGLFAFILSLIIIISWEVHLRNKGVTISYDDNEALWAYKRGLVYQPADRATVFIGDSRIKYDMDIPTWRELTGQDAIQLANVGSSPRAVLTDLASDSNFKGNILIDITEGVFFSETAFYDWKTNKKIAYFKDITPTQRFSFLVNHVLESQFVFLDQDNFSINGMLDNAQLLPPREGVFPGLYFPREFQPVSFDRQNIVTPSFIADTNLQVQVRNIWAGGLARRGDPTSAEVLDGIYKTVKRDIDKIKARGGKVAFIRPPSSGPLREAELKGFPRDAFWDKLINYMDCPGIYFSDYPDCAQMICPEWSHLSPADAVIYTKSVVNALKGKGWTFNHSAVQ